MITTIIVKAVKKIKELTKKGTQHAKYTKEIYISRLWYSILIKSVSDVAQFGSVIRNSHLIPNNEKTQIPPCISYLSSDLIAAAEATTLGRKVEHPYLILSTRKTANITQQIILQKREIAVTSIFLICMFDENTQYLQDIIGNYTSPDRDNEDSKAATNLDGAIVSGVYSDMTATNQYVDAFKNAFKTTLIANRQPMIINGNYRQQDTIIQQIQVWADEVVNGINANGRGVSIDNNINYKVTAEGAFKEEIYKPF